MNTLHAEPGVRSLNEMRLREECVEIFRHVGANECVEMRLDEGDPVSVLSHQSVACVRAFRRRDKMAGPGTTVGGVRPERSSALLARKSDQPSE